METNSRKVQSRVAKKETTLNKFHLVKYPKDGGFTTMNVLSLDPSLTAFGWVVCSKQKIIDAGCIKTTPNSKKLRIRKGDDRVRRISEINQELKRVIQKYKIQYILSELPHGSQSAQAALALGGVVGVVQTISDFTEISIEYFSEFDSKKCLLGKSSAEKSETISKVKQIFPNAFKFLQGAKYQNEAIADSLSVYYTGLITSNFLKTINNL